MPHLFLHETIDPVSSPGAHTRYLDEMGHIVQSEGNAKGSAGGICIANWVPIFLTGRWPQIIGFWQMPGDWDGFGNHFDAHRELFHEPLERWYGERSGAFDRLLVGSDFSPTAAQVVKEGLRARVVLHETITLRPGSATDYLGMLTDLKATLTQEPFDVFGAYEVAFRNGSEVIVLWAFPDVRTLTDTQARPDEFDQLRRWRTDSARLEVGNTGVVVRPTDWSPLR